MNETKTKSNGILLFSLFLAGLWSGTSYARIDWQRKKLPGPNSGNQQIAADFKGKLL